MKDWLVFRRLLGGLIALLALSLVAESAYRFHKYRQREAGYREDVGYTTTDGPLYGLDEQTGYTYVPDSRLTLRFHDGNNAVVGQNRVSVNNLGHLSPRDDVVEGTEAEFRIVCLGDSFTATTPTEFPWPAALEERLNADEELKERLGKSSFKVLNLGLDGTGIVHWPRVYQYKGKAFQPDLVIVSFIWHDILRKFLYRDTVPVESALADYSIMVICTSLPAVYENPDCLYGSALVIDSATVADKRRLSLIRREIHERKMASLPWFSSSPELLAAAFERGSRLDRRKSPTPLFADPEEALSESLEALRKIAADHPSVLFLFHPTVEECLAGKPLDLALDLMKRSGGVKIHNMLDFLPAAASQEEIKKWYNLPYDAHPSNYGCRLYAHAVHDRIRDQLLEGDGKKTAEAEGAAQAFTKQDTENTERVG